MEDAVADVAPDVARRGEAEHEDVRVSVVEGELYRHACPRVAVEALKGGSVPFHVELERCPERATGADRDHRLCEAAYPGVRRLTVKVKCFGDGHVDLPDRHLGRHAEGERDPHNGALDPGGRVPNLEGGGRALPHPIFPVVEERVALEGRLLVQGILALCPLFSRLEPLHVRLLPTSVEKGNWLGHDKHCRERVKNALCGLLEGRDAVLGPDGVHSGREQRHGRVCRVHAVLDLKEGDPGPTKVLCKKRPRFHGGFKNWHPRLEGGDLVGPERAGGGDPVLFSWPRDKGLLAGSHKHRPRRLDVERAPVGPPLGKPHGSKRPLLDPGHAVAVRELPSSAPPLSARSLRPHNAFCVDVHRRPVLGLAKARRQRHSTVDR